MKLHFLSLLMQKNMIQSVSSSVEVYINNQLTYKSFLEIVQRFYNQYAVAYGSVRSLSKTSKLPLTMVDIFCIQRLRTQN